MSSLTCSATYRPLSGRMQKHLRSWNYLTWGVFCRAIFFLWFYRRSTTCAGQTGLLPRCNHSFSLPEASVHLFLRLFLPTESSANPEDAPSQRDNPRQISHLPQGNTQSSWSGSRKRQRSSLPETPLSIGDTRHVGPLGSLSGTNKHVAAKLAC